MFVFPAFDSNYKTRKRTFQCCQNCRNKRIKCEITSKDYENLGCLTCRKHKWNCSLIRSTVPEVVEAKPKPPSVVHPPRQIPVNRGNNFTASYPYPPFPSPPQPIQRVPSINHSMIGQNNFQGMQAQGQSLHSIQNPQKPHFQNHIPLSPVNQVHPMHMGRITLPMFPSPGSRAIPNQPIHNIPPNAITGNRSRASSTTSSVTNEHTEQDAELLDLIYAAEHATKDVELLTPQYLKKRFNFNISGLDADSTYQLLTHGHPRVIIANASKDKTIWHESGVYMKMTNEEKYKVKNFGNGSSYKLYNIRNMHIYKFLLGIRAFTLSSDKYKFTYDDTLALVKVYFHKLNLIFPLVYEELFWVKFNAGKCQNTLLYLMILLILRDELSKPILQRVFARSGAKIDFAAELIEFMTDLEYKLRQIILILPQLGDDDKFNQMIVSLILLLHFNFDRYGNEKSSHDLTDAVNLAVTLGIHMKRLSKKLEYGKAEYTTNLWWCCYVLDRFNSIVNQRCIFIKQEDFNLDLPYSNTNLMKLIQLARAVEHMSFAIYQPFTDKPREEERYKLFDDEFQKNEFEFCDREHNHANLDVYSDTSNYIDNTSHFLARMVNNVVIICAQKAKYDDELIPNEIPAADAFRASKNILFYLTQMKDEHMINIPMIPWCVSLAMAVAMKKEAKVVFTEPDQIDTLEDIPEDPIYEFERYMRGLERFRGTWWIVDEIYRLSRDFMDKLHNRKERKGSRRKRQKLQPQLPREQIQKKISQLESPTHTPAYAIVGTPPTSKADSIPSIRNMVHQDQPVLDFGPSPPQNYPGTPNQPAARANSTTTSASLEESEIGFGQYDQYFESMQFDIFNNDFFKNVPNVINLLN